MNLTPHDLEALGLSPEEASAILEAHGAQLEALRTQAAAVAPLQAEQAQLRAELEAARAEAESLRRRHADGEARLRRGYLSDALLQAGANQAALPLLEAAVPDASLPEDPAAYPALIAPLRERHPGLFGEVVRLGLPPCQPPCSLRGPLTRQDVRRMSPEEINAHWPMVREALSV